MPIPPNEACVIPPHKKTIRRATTYVPTMPQAMPESTAATRASLRKSYVATAVKKSILPISLEIKTCKYTQK